MKKYSTSELWEFISRIEVESPAVTRDRAEKAIRVLDKCGYLDIDTYHEMMDAIAFMVRESYHR